MKIYLFWLITLFSIVSYSQGKCIAIAKNNSTRIDTVVENKRIKIQTVDGNTYWGRFTVIDSTSIMMKGKIIPLNSIVKIKRKSIGGTIVKPVVISIGAFCLVGATAGAVAGGMAIVATVVYTPIGIPMVLVPSISNNHRSKGWAYSIRDINENSIYSSEVGLREPRIDPLYGD